MTFHYPLNLCLIKDFVNILIYISENLKVITVREYSSAESRVFTLTSSLPAFNLHLYELGYLPHQSTVGNRTDFSIIGRSLEIPLIRKRHLLPLEFDLEKYLFLEELEALQNLELDVPEDQTPVNAGEVFEEIKDIIAGLQQLGFVILSRRRGGG